MPTTSPGVFDFERLTVAGVSRHYGRQRALSRVSLNVRAGEIIGLLGPNGAGKSTLLGVLATLIAPSRGRVLYGDLPARELGAALRRRLGYLSHELQLYPELTAGENLEFFARLYGDTRPADRVAAALAQARLAERGGDRVGGFSRGMRQRLALERALLHEPRLVLLDEPFTGLDERSVGDFVARLRGLRAAGRMVLLATHDLDVVDGLLDRAVVLRAGRTVPLAEDGGSLRERYRAAVADERAGRTTPDA
ncbi:MAG: ABC transporter ATP-binding protein [Acidobacteria bacterium]|nr:ABC transporter ATP-binding protein [Acidobacteriota bacterium]